MSLLTCRHLSVLAAHADPELQRIRDLVGTKLLVEGRGDLEAQLGHLLAEVGGAPVPKTLDLVGHSVAGAGVLAIGSWVIDTARPGVSAFFRELADHEVLPRLGIHALRLLGSRTAESVQARRTMCTLSEILGLEVYGTTGLVCAHHYTASGFDDAWRFLLAPASDVRHTLIEPTSFGVEPTTRSLDLDALPALPAEPFSAWPRRVPDALTTRAILRLVRRYEGTAMPGLLALPRCELAIPSTNPEAYRTLQLVLDGDFVRVYPDGPEQTGVLYPVTDPYMLRRLVDSLPLLS